MSEGKWIWDPESITVQPGDTYHTRQIIVMNPPPNEPRPDLLKRCEICRSRSTYAYGDLVCSNPKASHLKPRNCLQTLYYLPDSRTCEHWEWDEHGKDTDDEL